MGRTRIEIFHDGSMSLKKGQREAKYILKNDGIQFYVEVLLFQEGVQVDRHEIGMFLDEQMLMLALDKFHHFVLRVYYLSLRKDREEASVHG